MKRLQKIKNIRGLRGFSDFLRNQGVITLAIGFILGGAISKFVSSLVIDIINPVLSGLLGGVEDLNSKVVYINKIAVHYGVFLNSGIDFIVIAIVIYVGVRLFRMDQEQTGKMDISEINSLNTTSKK